MSKTKTTKNTGKTKTAKKAQVLSALKAGKTLTYETARTRFGVENLRATISDLRLNDGYTNIKTNIVNQKGTKVVKYTMA